MTEETKPPTEPEKTTDEQKGKSTTEAKGEKTQENTPESMAAVVANRLYNKQKDLEEAEKRIDLKIKEFKQFIADTQIQGKALAGSTVAESDEEKKKKEANTLLEGTGLSI